MNSLFNLKDRAILCGWIFGLVLLGALAWFFTQPLRAGALLRTVNRELAAAGDPRRLASSVRRVSAVKAPQGRWYSLENSPSLLLVFTIMRDGILVPCGAVVSPAGTVEEIVPLGSHARQVFDRLPPALIQIYTRKIESAGGKTGRSGR